MAIAARLAYLNPYEDDTFWHINSARVLVEIRPVPTLDPFTWPDPGPWTPADWLAELSLYAFDRAGGQHGAALWAASLSAVLVLVLACRLRTSGAPIAWIISVTACCIILLAPRLVARPYLVAEVLLILLWPLYARRRVALLLLLLVTWRNTHASYVIALAISGLAWLSALRNPAWTRAQRATLAAAIALSAFASPDPLAIWNFVVQHLSFSAHQGARQMVAEHYPLDVSDPFHAVILAVVTTASIAVVHAYWRKITWVAIVQLLLLTLALMFRRFYVMAVLWSVPLLVEALTPRLRSSKRWLQATAVSLSLAASLAVVARTPEEHRHLRSTYPVDAIDALERMGAQGPILTTPNCGGGVQYRLFGQVRTYSDTRLFGIQRYLSDLQRGARDPSHLVKLFEQFDAALVEHGLRPNFPLPLDEDPAWALVYWDDLAAVYVHRERAARWTSATAAYRQIRIPDLMYDQWTAGTPDDRAARGDELLRALNGARLCRLAATHLQRFASRYPLELSPADDQRLNRCLVSPQSVP